MCELRGEEKGRPPPARELKRRKQQAESGGGEEGLGREQWRGEGWARRQTGNLDGAGEGIRRGWPRREIGEDSWGGGRGGPGRGRISPGEELGRRPGAGELGDGIPEAGATRKAGGERCAKPKSGRKGGQCLARCPSVYLRS